MIRLQQLRLDKRLTVKQLAAASGVTRTTIARIESKPAGPVSPDVLHKLAAALDVSSPSTLLFPALESPDTEKAA